MGWCPGWRWCVSVRITGFAREIKHPSRHAQHTQNQALLKQNIRLVGAIDSDEKAVHGAPPTTTELRLWLGLNLAVEPVVTSSNSRTAANSSDLNPGILEF
eukprot:2712373-Rhodomonas_salina.2